MTRQTGEEKLLAINTDYFFRTRDPYDCTALIRAGKYAGTKCEHNAACWVGTVREQDADKAVRDTQVFRVCYMHLAVLRRGNAVMVGPNKSMKVKEGLDL
jgi:hypothetical protein